MVRSKVAHWLDRGVASGGLWQQRRVLRHVERQRRSQTGRGLRGSLQDRRAEGRQRYLAGPRTVGGVVHQGVRVRTAATRSEVIEKAFEIRR